MKTFLVLVLGIVLGFVGTLVAGAIAGPKLMIHEHVSPLGVAETVDRIKAAAEKDGWKILAVRKLEESIEKHTQRKVPPVHLVDLCEPNHAGDMMSDDDARFVSVLMPCTISVYEKTDGKTYIANMNAGLVARIFGGTISKIMAGPVADSQAKFVDAATATP